jgi:hypothetical protein
MQRTITVPTAVNGNGYGGHHRVNGNGRTNGDAQTGPSGRGEGGKFTSGNKFAAGNPLNKRAQQIRAALLEAVTPEAMGEAARKLLDQAKGGDLRAFAELADRTIGRPTTQDVVDRLERLEAALTALANSPPARGV